jgi:predicted DNA-binding WGR domain protein
MKKREFYLQDDQSNKYWTIEVLESAVITTNGRIGAKPRETRAAYDTYDAALREAEKEILSKKRKGYIEGDLSQVPEYISGLPPRFVRINHDDYHAKYVGKLASGDQFFLTFPFVPRTPLQDGGNYIALYLFDEFGILKEARIYNELEQDIKTQTAVSEFVNNLLKTLGKHKFGDIKVAPFCVEQCGQQFGLIFDPGEADDDDDEPYTCVTVEPGNYMAFSPPWDGDYDT